MQTNVPNILARAIGLVMSLVLVSGCATTHVGPDRTVRSAQDVPERFLVGTPNGSAATTHRASEGCRNPIVDPRDGTRLILVRSSDDRGDYAVPAGQYGVGARELLRVTCATGSPVGIVRR